MFQKTVYDICSEYLIFLTSYTNFEKYIFFFDYLGSAALVSVPFTHHDHSRPPHTHINEPLVFFNRFRPSSYSVSTSFNAHFHNRSSTCFSFSSPRRPHYLSVYLFLSSKIKTNIFTRIMIFFFFKSTLI